MCIWLPHPWTWVGIGVSKSLLVKGINNEVTTSALKRFMENTRRKGGGKVENIERPSDDTAIVHFEAVESKYFI